MTPKDQLIFNDLARYYDLIYSWKNYDQEAQRVKLLIQKYKTSPGTDLLEVACGTGRHAEFLQDDFSITATDAHEGMLEIARSRVKGVTFLKADMISLRLPQKFDVVLSLFSSIGYVKTDRNLRRTLANIGRACRPGGVVIIEPWFSKPVFRPGQSDLTTHSSDNIKIARMCVSRIRGDVSILDMDYLVSERDKPTRHYTDRHELGLFDHDTILKYLLDSHVKARFLPNGFMPDRGLVVGVKL
jgi:ubiquinone/menaquinone biosynthesis C-methylase UbiE